MTQTKGTSEAHPLLSPNDEFAGFEIWDKGNLDLSEVKKKSMLKFEYARAAYKNGLKLARKLGVNPYRFGLVGSTDAHTAIIPCEEENFFGKITPQEPGPHRMTKPFFHDEKTGLTIMDWETAAAGYAAVWATENTVDLATASWTNTIGDPELIAVWQDPDFDPAQPAFYYARVLEIPTPRWTAYDAVRLGVKPLPGTRMTVRERAYTSPIWYTP